MSGFRLKFIGFLSGVLLLAGCASNELAKHEGEVIELPLIVYLVHDLTVVKKGVPLTVWVKQEDVRKDVLPEINRIWAQAGIRWKLDSVREVQGRDIVDRTELASMFGTYGRGISREQRRYRRSLLTDVASAIAKDEDGYHLFIVPYVGQTLQGFQTPSTHFAFLGAWTDKPSDGNREPQKVKLVEEGALKLGSLARTASVMLGFSLGLRPRDCHEGCLLWGDYATGGYRLENQQIDYARKSASFFTNYEKAAVR